MGRKYCVWGYMNGYCEFPQKIKQSRKFIFILFWLIIFRFRYPIINFEIRNGYNDCNFCVDQELPCHEAAEEMLKH